MKRLLAVSALLLLTAPAHADCLKWVQTRNGTRVCVDGPAGASATSVTVPLTGSSVTNSAAPLPKCKDDEVLVTRPGAPPTCEKPARK